MNEADFARFLKGGLGTPAHSPVLDGRVVDALETGARPRRRVTKRLAFLIAAPAILVLAPTAVVAAGALLTPHDVEVGMPGGSAVFEGTSPKCTVVKDGVEYRCTLANAPTQEAHYPYLGDKQLLAGPDGKVAGGCIATSNDGLKWECYSGQAAVQAGILVDSLLGQPLNGPSHG
jgi:hypothetical protein